MRDDNELSLDERIKRNREWRLIEQRRAGIYLISAGIVLVLFVSALVWAWMIGVPKYNLYKANTEKRAVIEEQKAKSEAAEYEARSQVTQAQARADAEVIRAEGLAKSQAIISETLSEEYLRYLYIDAIKDSDSQIIYIPTEAGLPMTEAGRAVEHAEE